MSFDLFAEYPCIRKNDIFRIVGNDRRAPYTELEDIYTRVELLAQAVISNEKEFAKSGHYKYGGGYKSLVHYRKGRNYYTAQLIEERLKALDAMGVYPPSVDINSLPKYSAFLQFQFRLIRPYYSSDDTEFYIHENPVTKDMVFKIPMVRPSSWKGNMRNVANLVHFKKRWIKRVFGDASGEVDTKEGLAHKGRIRPYPTFFDAIDLEVINPHSRKTKAGTVPVMMEVAPTGARGYFSILYFPYDLINKPEDRVRREVAEDLELIVESVNGMMLAFGFAAKKNKGFGKTAYSFIRREDKVATGKFAISGVEIPEKKSKEKSSGGKDDWRAQLQQAQAETSSNETTFKDFGGMKSLIKRLGKELKK